MDELLETKCFQKETLKGSENCYLDTISYVLFTQEWMSQNIPTYILFIFMFIKWCLVFVPICASNAKPTHVDFGNWRKYQKLFISTSQLFPNTYLW